MVPVLPCITNNSIKHQSFVYTQLNVQTALFQLFQTIQFSISTWFSYIWPIDRTLSVTNTPGQSRPVSNDNEPFCGQWNGSYHSAKDVVSISKPHQQDFSCTGDKFVRKRLAILVFNETNIVLFIIWSIIFLML